MLSLKNDGAASPEADPFRRRMASVCAQFADDCHWETFAARAFSHHVDRQYEQAVEQYDKAMDIIDRDKNTHGHFEWQYRVMQLKRDREKAKLGQDL